MEDAADTGYGGMVAGGGHGRDRLLAPLPLFFPRFHEWQRMIEAMRTSTRKPL